MVDLICWIAKAISSHIQITPSTSLYDWLFPAVSPADPVSPVSPVSPVAPVTPPTPTPLSVAPEQKVSNPVIGEDRSASAAILTHDLAQQKAMVRDLASAGKIDELEDYLKQLFSIYLSSSESCMLSIDNCIKAQQDVRDHGPDTINDPDNPRTNSERLEDFQVLYRGEREKATRIVLDFFRLTSNVTIELLFPMEANIDVLINKIDITIKALDKELLTVKDPSAQETLTHIQGVLRTTILNLQGAKANFLEIKTELVSYLKTGTLDIKDTSPMKNWMRNFKELVRMHKSVYKTSLELQKVFSTFLK